jgi:hypothetical protein
VAEKKRTMRRRRQTQHRIFELPMQVRFLKLRKRYTGIELPMQVMLRTERRYRKNTHTGLSSGF